MRAPHGLCPHAVDLGEELRVLVEVLVHGDELVERVGLGTDPLDTAEHLLMGNVKGLSVHAVAHDRRAAQYFPYRPQLDPGAEGSRCHVDLENRPPGHVIDLVGQKAHAQLDVEKVVDAVERRSGNVAQDVELRVLAQEGEVLPVVVLEVLGQVGPALARGIPDDDLVRRRGRVVAPDRELGAGHFVQKEGEFLRRVLVGIDGLGGDDDRVARGAVLGQNERIRVPAACGQHRHRKEKHAAASNDGSWCHFEIHPVILSSGRCADGAPTS